MMSKIKKQPSNAINIIGTIVFILLVALDLFSKYWVDAVLDEGQVLWHWDKFLSITMVYNTGIAFSMFNDSKITMYIIMAFTVVLMIAISIWFFKTSNKNKFLKICLSFILAGALGNLVDRVLWTTGLIKGVRDFLDLSFFGFGVCNFADFFIVGGGIALLICLLFVGDDALFFGKKKQIEEKK